MKGDLKQELDNWKRKYLLQLDQADKERAHWRDVELLLKLAVSRLSNAARKQDDKLDGQIEQLLELLKGDEMDQRRFKVALAGFSDRLLQLDNIHEQRLRSRVEILRRLLDQFYNLPLKEAAQKEVATLKQEVDKLAQDTDRSLVSFSRLLTQLDLASMEPSGNSSATASATRPDGQAAEGQPATDDPRFCRSIAHHLVALVDHLSVPTQVKPKLVEVQNRFNRLDELAQLPDTLDALVQVVAEANTIEQQQFEQFAELMVQRFNQVEEFLDRTVCNQQEVDDLASELDEDMRSHFDGMITEVREATNLGDLQQTMEAHIGKIFDRLDRFREENSQRRGVFEAELRQLADELQEAKNETLNLRKLLTEQEARGLEDPLTGLGNRRAYQQRIEEELSRFDRYGTPLALVVCDLDHFKHINDTHGHLAGDRVLRVVAQLLLRLTRKSDFVGRYGGEEFVVLLPNTTDETALLVAEKLRSSLEKLPFESGGKKIAVTMSMGLTHASKGDMPDSLFKRADELLYQAKNAGRNRVVSDLDR